MSSSVKLFQLWSKNAQQTAICLLHIGGFRCLRSAEKLMQMRENPQYLRIRITQIFLEIGQRLDEIFATFERASLFDETLSQICKRGADGGMVRTELFATEFERFEPKSFCFGIRFPTLMFGCALEQFRDVDERTGYFSG